MLRSLGPPLVIVQISPNTDSVCRGISIRLVAIERRSIGSVTDTSLRTGPATQITAASSISLGPSERAAEYTSIENAVPRQMLAIDTARIGVVNSQFCTGRPIPASTWLSEPSGPRNATHR